MGASMGFRKNTKDTIATGRFSIARKYVANPIPVTPITMNKRTGSVDGFIPVNIGIFEKTVSFFDIKNCETKSICDMQISTKSSATPNKNPKEVMTIPPIGEDFAKYLPKILQIENNTADIRHNITPKIFPLKLKGFIITSIPKRAIDRANNDSLLMGSFKKTTAKIIAKNVLQENIIAAEYAGM